MMHAQRYARLYLLDVLAEAIEGLHGDVARVGPSHCVFTETNVQRSDSGVTRRSSTGPSTAPMASRSSWFPGTKYVWVARPSISVWASRYASTDPSCTTSPVTTMTSTCAGSAFITSARFSAGLWPQACALGSLSR